MNAEERADSLLLSAFKKKQKNKTKKKQVILRKFEFQLHVTLPLSL